jgi:hypothetical protein
MASGRAAPCIDCVFTVSLLIEKRNEFNLPIYITFIDHTKAFYMASRNKLWQILALKGFPHHLTRAIQSLYEETNIVIETVDRKSQKIILINQGVRQGCPLSPVLFNLYLDLVIREWQDSIASYKLIH